MNGENPAAIDKNTKATDIEWKAGWITPCLLFAVPSAIVGRFTFQPIQCTTSVLSSDAREKLVDLLATNVHQFKIGVQLTTASGEAAESKGEYDASAAPGV